MTVASRAAGALVLLFVGAAAIGSSAIWVRLAETGPVATGFWRIALALPFLWAWAVVTARRAPAGAPRSAQEPVPSDLRGLCAAGAFFAGDLAFWHWSILHTSVANATLLANVAPFFVSLAGWLWLRERIAGGFIAGLGLAFVGTLMLVGADFAHGGRALVGDALGVVTALFYAAYLLALKDLRARVSTARIMAVSGAVTAALLLPLALLAGDRILPESASGWLTLAGLALVSQVAGQSLIAYAFAHLPASLASVGLLLQPLAATVFAWAILGENITPLQACGGIAVLAGIRLAQRASARTSG
jgi:drug/metabolite transporter (DMT)-like permease